MVAERQKNISGFYFVVSLIMCSSELHRSLLNALIMKSFCLVIFFKDPNEGHWWMQFGDDYVLGYWPSFLFSYLGDSASMVEWGGEVVNTEPSGEHTSTQMGSGHFPEEGFGKASYFRNLQIVDGSNNLRAPKAIGTFTERSGCYDVQTGSNADWGHYFYYGGPGRNPKCA